MSVSGDLAMVPIAVAGCRELGLARPREAGKRPDALQAVTGVSLGKRTLKHIDCGKDVQRGSIVPGWLDRRRMRSRARSAARA